MGKTTGFLEYDRKENSCLAPEERIKNFNEFHPPLSKEDRKEQGGRCMNCGVPFCQSTIRLSNMVTGCPLHNLIPEWNDEIYNDNMSHGLARLLKTNNFPEFTGRVCPALCEKACICGMNGDPVTIRENELYLIETGFKNGDMKPRIPKIRSDKKVAVIGSGPAGLAVADRLNQRGHNVTVYEKEDRIGGLLMYGIPNMKLEKEVVNRRVNLMKEEGITFLTNKNVGENVKAKDILAEYDAVVLCCGAGKPRDLAIKNRDAKGIYFAVDFLTATTKDLLGEKPSESNYISTKGKNVIVVGGGDTGNDCVGTCIRQGAKSVRQIEMMKEPPKQRLDSNPWPEWPKVLKTDYGQEEAIAMFGSDPRTYETTVKEVVVANGKMKAVKLVQVKFDNGKLVEVPGTETVVNADILLIAAGFVGCQNYIADAFSVKLTDKNTVEGVNDSYRTTVNKVFTAGDMHRGQSLVVWAIEEGRNCARQVDEFLMGYTNMGD